MIPAPEGCIASIPPALVSSVWLTAVLWHPQYLIQQQLKINSNREGARLDSQLCFKIATQQQLKIDSSQVSIVQLILSHPTQLILCHPVARCWHSQSVRCRALRSTMTSVVSLVKINSLEVKQLSDALRLEMQLKLCHPIAQIQHSQPVRCRALGSKALTAQAHDAVICVDSSARRML